MLELELPLSNKTSRVTNLTHYLSLLLATNHLPRYPLPITARLSTATPGDGGSTCAL